MNERKAVGSSSPTKKCEPTDNINSPPCRPPIAWQNDAGSKEDGSSLSVISNSTSGATPMLVSALSGLIDTHANLKLVSPKNDSEMSPEIPRQTGLSTLDQDVNTTQTPENYILSEEPLTWNTCKRLSNLRSQSVPYLNSQSQQTVLEDSQMDLFESQVEEAHGTSIELFPKTFLENSSQGYSVLDKTDKVGEAEKYSLQSNGVQSKMQILTFEEEVDICTSHNVKCTDESSLNKTFESNATTMSKSTEINVNDIDGSSESIYFNSTMSPVTLNNREIDLCKSLRIECSYESSVNKIFESKTTIMSGTTDTSVSDLEGYNKSSNFNTIMSPISLYGSSVNKVFESNDATMYNTTEGNANEMVRSNESIHCNRTLSPGTLNHEETDLCKSHKVDSTNESSVNKIFESNALTMSKATGGNFNDVDGSSESIHFNSTISPFRLSHEETDLCKSYKVKCSDESSVNKICESNTTIMPKPTHTNGNDMDGRNKSFNFNSIISPTTLNQAEVDLCKSHNIISRNGSSVNKIFESNTTDANVNDMGDCNESIHSVSTISPASCFHIVSLNHENTDLSTSHKIERTESSATTMCKNTDTNVRPNDRNDRNESAHSFSTISPISCFRNISSGQPERAPSYQVDQREYGKGSETAKTSIVEMKKVELVFSSPESSVSSRFFIENPQNERLNRYKQNFESSKILSTTIAEPSFFGKKKLDIYSSSNKQSKVEESVLTGKITAGHADVQQMDNANPTSRDPSVKKVLYNDEDVQCLFNKCEDKQRGEHHPKEMDIKRTVAVSVASLPATSNSEVQPRKQSQKSNSQSAASVGGKNSQSCSMQADDNQLQPYLRLVSLYDKMLEKLDGSKQIDGTKELKKFEEILDKLRKSLDAETKKTSSSSDYKDRNCDEDLIKREKLKLKHHHRKEEVLQIAVQKHKKLRNRVLLIQARKEKLLNIPDKKSNLQSIKHKRMGELNSEIHCPNALSNTTDKPENESQATTSMANLLSDFEPQKEEKTCLQLTLNDGMQIEIDPTQLPVKQSFTNTGDTTTVINVDVKPNNKSEIYTKVSTHHSEQEEVVRVDTDKDLQHEKERDRVSSLELNNSFGMKRTKASAEYPSKYLHKNTGPSRTLDLTSVRFSCSNGSMVNNIDASQAQLNVRESTGNLHAMSSETIANSSRENQTSENCHVSSPFDSASLANASKRMSGEEYRHTTPAKIHRIQRTELECCGNVLVGDLCESDRAFLSIPSDPSKDFGSCQSTHSLPLKLPVSVQNANTTPMKSGQRKELLGQISQSKINASEKMLLYRPAGCCKSRQINDFSQISQSLKAGNQDILKQSSISAGPFVTTNIVSTGITLQSTTNDTPADLTSISNITKPNKSGDKVNVLNNLGQTSNSICFSSQWNKSDGKTSHFSVNTIIPEVTGKSSKEVVEPSHEIPISDGICSCVRNNRNNCDDAQKSSEAFDIPGQNYCASLGTLAMQNEILERSPRNKTVLSPSALSQRLTMSEVSERHRNDAITTEMDMTDKIRANISKMHARSNLEQYTIPVFNSNSQPSSPNSVSTATTSLFPVSSKEIAKRMAHRMKNKQQVPETDSIKPLNRDAPVLSKDVSHSYRYLQIATDVSNCDSNLQNQVKDSPKRDDSKMSAVFNRSVLKAGGDVFSPTNCHTSEGKECAITHIQPSSITKQNQIQYLEVKTGSSNPSLNVSPSHKPSLKEPTGQMKHCSLVTPNPKTQTNFNIISTFQRLSSSQPAWSAPTNASLSQTPKCKSSTTLWSQPNKRGRKRTCQNRRETGNYRNQGINQGKKLSDHGNQANGQITSYFPSSATAPSSGSVSGKRILDSGNPCKKLSSEFNTCIGNDDSNTDTHTSVTSYSQIPAQAEGEMSDLSTLIRNLDKIKLIECGELNLSCSDFPDAFWTENFSDIRISKQLLNSVDVWD